MDNYSRLLLLLPIYLLFSKILIMPALFFKYVKLQFILLFLFFYMRHLFLSMRRYMGTSSTSITFANLLMTLNIFTLLEIIERSKSNKTNTLFYISRLITIIISFYLWSETQIGGINRLYFCFVLYIIYL